MGRAADVSFEWKVWSGMLEEVSKAHLLFSQEAGRRLRYSKNREKWAWGPQEGEAHQE